jgi:hypothetical protein
MLATPQTGDIRGDSAEAVKAKPAIVGCIENVVDGLELPLVLLERFLQLGDLGIDLGQVIPRIEIVERHHALVEIVSPLPQFVKSGFGSIQAFEKGLEATIPFVNHPLERSIELLARERGPARVPQVEADSIVRGEGGHVAPRSSCKGTAILDSAPDVFDRTRKRGPPRRATLSILESLT